MNHELAQLLLKQKDRETLKAKALKVEDSFPYCSMSALNAYIFAAGVIEGKRTERARRKGHKDGVA